MEIASLSLNENDQNKGIIYIYTGISCMYANTSHPRAAVCICFNADENNTMIELLDKSLCTNQKAELHALYRALSFITDETNICIVSKSEYAVKCINVWSQRWRLNDWEDTPRNSADNKNIVRLTVELMEDLIDEGKNIKIYHWEDVLNKEGNHIAYNLARETLLNYS